MGITGNRIEAYAQYMNCEFEKVVMFDDKYGDDYKVDDLIATSYLYMGNIWLAYRKFKSIDNNPSYFDEAKANAKIFIDKIEKLIGHFNIKQPDDFNRKQSVENSIEEYPELHTLNDIMKSEDENRRLAYFREVDIMTQSPYAEDRALGFFITAEVYVLMGKYEEAIANYISALQSDHNKALYWGYCGQILNTHLNYDPIQCLYFLDNAENLDSKNPRWKFLKSLALFRKGREILEIGLNENTYWNFRAYYSQAIKYLHSARELCAYNQSRLLQAINSYEQTIVHFKGHLDDLIEKYGQ